jgi:hypothetical protein
MPLISITVGPYSQIYVGDYGGSDILLPIDSIATGAQIFVDELPEEFVPSIENSAQSGLHRVSIKGSYYGDNNLLIKLARGLSVDATPIDSGSTFAQYTLLLMHPEETSDKNLLIHRCYTTKRMELNYQKDQATQLNLEFVAINRNRFVELYNFGTADDLAVILGARSPI